MLIDLHSHHEIVASDTKGILNVILRENEALALPETAFSIGIHPWYLPETLSGPMSQLEFAVTSPFCMAIGECGIDRAIKTPLARQETFFHAQADLAARFNKPLILHCVKAYSEMIRIRKLFSKAKPWILHSFNGNEKELKECVRNEFFFSVTLSGSRASIRPEVLQKLPLERLFLETDEAEIPIACVYSKAAEILAVPIDKLVKQINLNFENIFR